MGDAIEEMKATIEALRKEMDLVSSGFEDVIDELAEFNDMDPRKKLDHLQRKIMRSAFDELMTPHERNLNVDLK